MALNYELLSKIRDGINPLVETFQKIVQENVCSELKRVLDDKVTTLELFVDDFRICSRRFPAY